MTETWGSNRDFLSKQSKITDAPPWIRADPLDIWHGDHGLTFTLIRSIKMDELKDTIIRGVWHHDLGGTESWTNTGYNRPKVLIDIRPAEEVDRTGTIPGAARIPLSSLDDFLAKLQASVKAERKKQEEQWHREYETKRGRITRATIGHIAANDAEVMAASERGIPDIPTYTVGTRWLRQPQQQQQPNPGMGFVAASSSSVSPGGGGGALVQASSLSAAAAAVLADHNSTTATSPANHGGGVLMSGHEDEHAEDGESELKNFPPFKEVNWTSHELIFIGQGSLLADTSYMNRRKLFSHKQAFRKSLNAKRSKANKTSTDTATSTTASASPTNGKENGAVHEDAETMKQRAVDYIAKYNGNIRQA